jgi:16S rRNA U516 pseudouridylate synthase RsuA-like enzyme
MRIKLQDYLKRHGYASSNRNAKRLIRDHTVKVNGVEAKSCSVMVSDQKSPAVQVVIKSEISDCQSNADVPITKEECSDAAPECQPLCIIYHKPCGMMCTKSTSETFCLNQIDPPIPDNYHPVGRLDQHSHGLLLFSLDGRLTSALLSPNTAVERVYQIVVRGDVGVENTIDPNGESGNNASDDLINKKESKYNRICKQVEDGIETDYGFFKGRILHMQRNVDKNYEHSKCCDSGGKRNDTFDHQEPSSRETTVINTRFDKDEEKEERQLDKNISGETETIILSSITVAVKEGKKRMVRRLFAAIGLFVVGECISSRCYRKVDRK